MVGFELEELGFVGLVLELGGFVGLELEELGLVDDDGLVELAGSDLGGENYLSYFNLEIFFWKNV